MNKYYLAGGVSVAALLVLVWLALQVGGLSIRGASLTYEIGVLETSTTRLLPGVPVTVSLAENVSAIRSQSSALMLRLPRVSLKVGNLSPEQLSSGSFSLMVPCDGEVLAESQGENVRLVLVDNKTQAILAQSKQMKLLPPGPDCLLK